MNGRTVSGHQKHEKTQRMCSLSKIINGFKEGFFHSNFRERGLKKTVKGMWGRDWRSCFAASHFSILLLVNLNASCYAWCSKAYGFFLFCDWDWDWDISWTREDLREKYQHQIQLKQRQRRRKDWHHLYSVVPVEEWTAFLAGLMFFIALHCCLFFSYQKQAFVRFSGKKNEKVRGKEILVWRVVVAQKFYDIREGKKTRQVMHHRQRIHCLFVTDSIIGIIIIIVVFSSSCFIISYQFVSESSVFVWKYTLAWFVHGKGIQETGKSNDENVWE